MKDENALLEDRLIQFFESLKETRTMDFVSWWAYKFEKNLVGEAYLTEDNRSKIVLRKLEEYKLIEVLKDGRTVQLSSVGVDAAEMGIEKYLKKIKREAKREKRHAARERFRSILGIPRDIIALVVSALSLILSILAFFKA